MNVLTPVPGRARDPLIEAYNARSKRIASWAAEVRASAAYARRAVRSGAFGEEDRDRSWPG